MAKCILGIRCRYEKNKRKRIIEKYLTLTEKIAQTGKNPRGIIGKISGTIMNLGHKAIYLWGLKNLNIKQGSTILDVGCSGGKAVKAFSEIIENGTICGIDHSKVKKQLIDEVMDRCMDLIVQKY